MIIWNGAGLLVPVIAFLPFLATEIIVGSDYYAGHTWPKLMAAGVAGALLWLVGRKLNRSPRRVLVDLETSEEVVLPPRRHDLFFVKIEYWCFFIVALTILRFVVGDSLRLPGRT